MYCCCSSLPQRLVLTTPLLGCLTTPLSPIIMAPTIPTVALFSTSWSDFLPSQECSWPSRDRTLTLLTAPSEIWLPHGGSPLLSQQQMSKSSFQSFSICQNSSSMLRVRKSIFLHIFIHFFDSEGFNFGECQDGTMVDHVKLPPWAEHNARLFILKHRQVCIVYIWKCEC